MDNKVSECSGGSTRLVRGNIYKLISPLEGEEGYYICVAAPNEPGFILVNLTSGRYWEQPTRILPEEYFREVHKGTCIQIIAG